MTMQEGIYVVCDPDVGWSVKALDQFGNVLQVFTHGHMEMESAVRVYATNLGKPVAFKLSPGQVF
jgi:hypothetical protein